MAVLAEMRREMEMMKKKSEEDLNKLWKENERLRQRVEREEWELKHRKDSTEQEGSQKEGRGQAS